MKYLGYVAASVIFVSAFVPSNASAQKAAEPNFDCALFDECGEKSPAAVESAPVVRQSGAVRGGFTLRREPAAGAPVSRPPVAGARPSAAPTARPPRIARPSSPAPTGRMEAERIRAGQMITFVSGSAVLSAQAKAVAQKLAQSMQRPDKAGLRYRIEGHTDAIGTRDRNLELSKQRAQSVVAYLGSLGVDVKKLEPVGLGFDQPISGVAKTSAANRRVVAKPIS
jgi:OmpA-OmpF porin, OOP family